MNDNHRTPEAHRAAVQALSKSQPQGNPRPYKAAVWPQGERLAAIGRADLVRGLMDWQRLNDQPILCVANDNYEDTDDSGADQVREPVAYDNRLLHDTADRTVALHDAGKTWQPGDERFTQPRRNDPGRSIPVGMFTFNGAAYYQAEACAEDESNRVIDCNRIRAKLGLVPCRLLDEASADSTTDRIAAIINRDNNATEKYIDASIAKFIAIAA